uniref:Uncharacterized protein n=1 Tax=Arundo donax TaxID=35708 RepID=A0A0A9DPY1_ARUDO
MSGVHALISISNRRRGGDGGGGRRLYGELLYPLPAAGLARGVRVLELGAEQPGS